MKKGLEKNSQGYETSLYLLLTTATIRSLGYSISQFGLPTQTVLRAVVHTNRNQLEKNTWEGRRNKMSITYPRG